LTLDDVRNRLKDRRITLSVPKETLVQMAKDSYTPAFGARPVKRFIQQTIETKLGRALISGEFGEDDHILVNYVDGTYVFSKS
jgi:ATP-dependent Clp protease ATP-binding subunit ClpB